MHKNIENAQQNEKPAQKKLTLEDLAQVSGGRMADGLKSEVSDGGYSQKFES